MSARVLAAVLLSASVAGPAGAAARAQSAARRADKARAKASTPAKASPRAAASSAAPSRAAESPVAGPREQAELAAVGAGLSERDGGLTVADVRPGSVAAEMGLRAGDRLWRLGRGAPRTRAEAAAALRAAAPEMRASMVVRRGLEALALSGDPSPAPSDFARGAHDLSAYERVLARTRANGDETAAGDAVASAPPLEWGLRADQAVWVRFPKGLDASLMAGDVLEAEAATGLTTDGSLDFLAVPPKSRFWAKVVSASDDGSVQTVRLAFYKVALAGGRTYPVLAAATALAAVPAPDMSRVTSGGTIAVAAPLPRADGKKPKGSGLILDSEARLRVRLLDPVSVSEPRSWWRAGPGLWLKTVSDDAGKRRFQVTHVVAGRSAAAAGLKVGDVLDGVDGRSAERIDFEQALDALYGEPGTPVRVSVVRPDGSKTLTLTRGVKVDGPVSVLLALPFESR